MSTMGDYLHYASPPILSLYKAVSVIPPGP